MPSPRRRRGGVKRRETDLASNQFPVFSTARNTQKDSQSWVEKRRGREENRGDLVDKKDSQMEERAVKTVIIPPSKNGY